QLIVRWQARCGLRSSRTRQQASRWLAHTGAVTDASTGRKGAVKPTCGGSGDLLFQCEEWEERILQLVELVRSARLHQLARAGFRQRLAHQLLVERVAGLHRNEMSDDRHPEKRQIANRVEDFVADEFIRKAQPFGVQDVEIVDDDGVLERPAAGQPGAVQSLDVALEAERARPRDLLLE